MVSGHNWPSHVWRTTTAMAAKWAKRKPRPRVQFQPSRQPARIRIKPPVTNKTKAFDLALSGGFKLGILYREQRATLNEQYKALVDASKESDLATMLEAFNARKGAAIGKPAL